MGQHDEQEPTHALPPELVAALLGANEWHKERERLGETVRRWGGSAQRNQEDQDEIDRRAAPILAEIVEVIDRTWGFAK